MQACHHPRIVPDTDVIQAIHSNTLAHYVGVHVKHPSTVLLMRTYVTADPGQQSTAVT